MSPTLITECEQTTDLCPDIHNIHNIFRSRTVNLYLHVSLHPSSFLQSPGINECNLVSTSNLIYLVAIFPMLWTLLCLTLKNEERNPVTMVMNYQVRGTR